MGKLDPGPVTEGRRLRERLLGMNCEAAFVSSALALARPPAPRGVRLPGGTPSNFFKWRTGLMPVQANEGSSTYRRMLPAVIASESFADVEAGRFRGPGGTTPIAHNASAVGHRTGR